MGLTPCISGWVAIRTILAPDSNAKSWSTNWRKERWIWGNRIYNYTCWDIVQGIRSPDALIPLDKPFKMEDFEISPSKHTCVLDYQYTDILKYYIDILKYYTDILKYYIDILKYYIDILKYHIDILKYYIDTCTIIITCSTHNTSGNDVCSEVTGGSNTNTWCAGASDNNCKSLGVFL